MEYPEFRCEVQDPVNQQEVKAHSGQPDKNIVRIFSFVAQAGPRVPYK